MRGQREVETREKWSWKRGAKLKQGGRPEGTRGQKRVDGKMGGEAETGWEAGGKQRPEKRGGRNGVGG